MAERAGANEFVAAVLRARPDLAADPAIAQRLEALDAAARTAWPTLSLPTPRWARHVAVRWSGEGTLDGPGLWLACAGLGGEPEALAALDAELRAVATAALGRLRLDAASADEVLQRARSHLLLSTAGEVPRLARFAGRGSLRDWLRTVLVRLAADLRRARTPEVALDELVVSFAGTGDPERDLVRADARAHLGAALEEAFTGLDARDRAVLRLHVGEGLSIDDLAPILGASRATVARWLGAAREAWASAARATLARRVPGAELEVLMLGVRRSLDLSLERIVRGRA